jgi:hypothetical protein
MPQLSTLISYVKQIDNYIQDLRNGMAHAHPHSVDALRSYVEELENIRDTILGATLKGGQNLDALLGKVRDCLKACVSPTYTGKPAVLPPPTPETPEPKITVPGVNIIMVIDASHSMIPELSIGARIYKVIVDFANTVKQYAAKGNIPATVSLVWYGDPTNLDNQKKNATHPNGFWWIAMNKGNVNDFPNKVSGQFPVNMWKKGKDFPESGMTCIYQCLSQVYKPGVENSLILVSDDWQKLEGSSKPSHRNFKETTLSAVTGLANNLKVRNRYAIVPASKMANIRPFFKDIKDYDRKSLSIKDIMPWVIWTLDPTSTVFPNATT